jgi:hypothetical protein
MMHERLSAAGGFAKKDVRSMPQIHIKGKREGRETGK